MTRRGLFTGIGALTLGNLASACSPLGLLNTLGPRDRGARRIARGLAYGAAARQKFDLYGAAWSEGQPRAPVIVFFYGGGWDSGSRADYGWAAQALAARGFLVVLPDYRLVPQVHFPAFIEDAAVRAFMAEANPAALRETAARLAEALERGLWKPRSNSAGLLLAQLMEA